MPGRPAPPRSAPGDAAPSGAAAPGPSGRPMADPAEVHRRLQALHGPARTELDHRDAFELLVATVLSAQTTDVRVNAVTPELFSRWPDAAALAGADPAQVEAVVRPLGMGATRARRIIGLAAGLCEDHGGEVPEDHDALERLPGVGRKTAHVVRGTWFGRSALAVDTHVGRLARRLGWTGHSDPRRVEEDVVDLVERTAPRPSGRAAPGPEESGAVDLTSLSLLLILHGRRVCTARSPRCDDCVLAPLCPSAGIA
ncbi:endonuclease III [Brachybacterium phenoliresistens]